AGRPARAWRLDSTPAPVTRGPSTEPRACYQGDLLDVLNVAEPVEHLLEGLAPDGQREPGATAATLVGRAAGPWRAVRQRVRENRVSAGPALGASGRLPPARNGGGEPSPLGRGPHPDRLLRHLPIEAPGPVEVLPLL